MKKLLAVLLVLTLVMTMVTGCGKASDDKKEPTTAPTAAVEPTTAPTDAPATEPTTETPDATADAAKTGFAIVPSIAKSTDATADADGLAEVDSLIAAVIVDKDGKIVDCQIDAEMTKMNFSVEGKLTTDVATTFKTKQELGEEYGMKSASGIGKEWYEQANAFAAYVVGKTVDEVKGIAVNEEGLAGDADLAASITVHIGSFIAVVEKAVNNAQELGATTADQVGFAATIDMAKSTDATADAAGLAQSYANYAVVTVGADGKITSCIIDAAQGNINFGTDGKVTTDLATVIKTKQELKEEYGMKAASGIGKEWYEQANAFAAYVTGKSVDEVTGIALSDEGKAADADLAASVTVHIGPFMANVAKAVANAAK